MRAPARVPPVTSLIQHGSPDNLFYRSADRRPLVMEAHQHLGRQISLACCRAIDMDIVNVQLVERKVSRPGRYVNAV